MDVALLAGSLSLGWIAWGILGLVLIAFGIFSGILYWHWQLYSTGRYTTLASMFVYLAVSAFFVALMTLGAVWLSVGVV